MFIKATAWTYDREYDGSTGLTIKTEVKLLFASIVRDSDNLLCEYAKIMRGETQITCLMGGGGERINTDTQHLCTG